MSFVPNIFRYRTTKHNSEGFILTNGLGQIVYGFSKKELDSIKTFPVSNLEVVKWTGVIFEKMKIQDYNF